MPRNSPITQQAVSKGKFQRVKEMRHEMTPAESKLWTWLRANRLEGFHFRRQQIIEPYIVDFYCHQAALVVEVDGDIHISQHKYDQQRDQDLQLLGLRVLRFDNSEIIQNIDDVLAEILQACRTAACSAPDLEEI